MELALFVYLADIVGNAKGLFIVIAIASVLLCLATGMFSNGEISKKSVYIYICIWLFSAIVATLLPSEKTMYLMAGAYTTQSVVQSTVGKKTVDLIEQKLDEELAKLKEKK